MVVIFERWQMIQCVALFVVLCVLRTEFVQAQSTMSLEPTTLSVNEGATANIIVNVVPMPLSPLTVYYTLGMDTDDADNSDYADSANLQIMAGDVRGVISIPIIDDDLVEPPRERFTVKLNMPGPDAGYILGLTTTTTVIINEGVCDRTPQVRDWIARQVSSSSDCTVVTSEHFMDLQEDMDLHSRGITTLKAGDFAGLNVSTLHLEKNFFKTLPAGVFQDFNVAHHLYLDTNELIETACRCI